MNVPNRASVLVVGGGPGGSYAACVLAQKGVDVFGATFKITEEKPSYTDFSATLGPGGHSWNVIRAESDEMIFRHATRCGVKTFKGTKVESLSFEPFADAKFSPVDYMANPGRQVSATWSRKDGTTGAIAFDYLIDASGRYGLMSNKYLHNRRFNQGLKNIANWTYWKDAKRYDEGGRTENSPLFEGLSDASGWAWAIPLHDGTLSCGIVVYQERFFEKKKASGLDGLAFYKDYLKLAPQISDLLHDASVMANLRRDSDWSYGASAYAGPGFRIVGDAGCFVDPYFSSGVHLALTSGLSAAATIQASRRKQCDEFAAAKWHDTKVSESYTRWLLFVMTFMRQLRMKQASFVQSGKDSSFDTAFRAILSVIQGTVDMESEDAATQTQVATSVDLALEHMQATPEAVTAKITQAQDKLAMLETLTPEEVAILNKLIKRTLQHEKSDLKLMNFVGHVVEGLSARLIQGDLGLMKCETTC
ncbi:hypothetical protein M409DRAFT_69145 [Zasmidium cellare ATCC 36951]|uniref:FAD-binding domain-containing protein n=1 Tax=Zasmidium cellare ATCC 36951 TaxID=1080233 RepID=A0A6A6C5Y8_ZASCE|nr:uncharacterized protein M409DRAFT_69145 [Zasmidium cellare ATCC 36951]KAF2162587.1 hypothetical protein M409DRAFT_69145 [Zasmidium cellare ATCC 36951]